VSDSAHEVLAARIAGEASSSKAELAYSKLAGVSTDVLIDDRQELT